MKLMNFTEKLLALSAVEFDKICIGRIERQTEEVCFDISKKLFAAIKRAELIIKTKDQIDRNSEDKVNNFKKFSQLLE